MSSIASLKNRKTKGLLRALAVRDPRHKQKPVTIEILRDLLLSTEDSVVEQIIRTTLFAHLTFVDDFPIYSSTEFRNERPNVSSLQDELRLQGFRILTNTSRIAEAFSDLKQLNSAFYEDDAVSILTRLRSFRECYGYSLIYLRKLAFAYTLYEQDDDLREYCAQQLESLGLKRGNIIAISSLDLMGQSQDYLTLQRTLMDPSNERKIRKTPRSLIETQFNPITRDRDVFASRLLAHGFVSVIDAAVFICTHRYNSDTLADCDLEINGISFLGGLAEKWQALSADPSPALIDKLSAVKRFSDLTFFRRSIAFIELACLARYRLGLDWLFNDKKASILPRSDNHSDFAASYFEDVTVLADLATAPVGFSIQLTRFFPEEAGTFTRTLAFMYLLYKDNLPQTITEQQLLMILDNTTSIAQLVHVERLKSFFDSADPTRLVKYLSLALISDCSSSEFDHHRFRRALQDLVISEFEGDLIRLADYFFENAKNVAQHLISTCTEGFLSQLFFLIPQPEQIYETRAQLLDWFAIQFDEPVARERAKTLRLDARLRQIRGEIDDTRLYVDPLRFSQWLEDNVTEELSSVLHLRLVTIKDADIFKEFSDHPAANRAPHVRLAGILQQAFREFCENKRYGIDSYIGRRIRHGTLKGVMITQLAELLHERRYQAVMHNTQLSNFFYKWLADLEALVEHIGRETIRIRSKASPKGAISTDITSSRKLETTRAALRDIIRAYSVQDNILDAGSVIFEYCWRLIERDLQPLRETLEQSRLSCILDRATLKMLCSVSEYPLASELCRKLDILVNEKFKTLAGWFSKPTNLAPSAPVNLLLEAVLSEARDLFPDYKPRITRTGLADVELVGMLYHHLYDFLNVVIRNAAKHGMKSGQLNVDLSLSEISISLQSLEISVASQIRDDQNISELNDTIGRVMNASTDDAMVIEGNSGIKKLRTLAEDVPQIAGIFYKTAGNMLTFWCVLQVGKS